jgi:hypothetical protein
MENKQLLKPTIGQLTAEILLKKAQLRVQYDKFKWRLPEYQAAALLGGQREKDMYKAVLEQLRIAERQLND